MTQLIVNNEMLITPETNQDLISFEDIILNTKLSKMKSGDIILFSGKNSIISSIIKWWTDSFYSHVGIVLVNPKIYSDNIFKELKGVYLIESGYESNIEDAFEHRHKFGVQIVPLIDVIKNYNGNIYWRGLNLDNSSMTRELVNIRMSSIYKNIRDKPYDLNLFDLLCCNLNIFYPEITCRNPIINWFLHDTQKRDKFVCSALVAYFYTKIGFLPEITHWTECTPKFFSDENTKVNSSLLKDVYLENQEKLK